MKRKAFIMLAVLISTVSTAYAQSSHYMRADLSTDVSSSVFGMGLSFTFGRQYKGFDWCLSLEHYDDTADKSKSRSVSYTDNGTTVIGTKTGDYGTRMNSILGDLSFGYDLLYLTAAKRHHITPFVSVGYCKKHTSEMVNNPSDGMSCVELDDITDCGFETSLGVRYEFDIKNGSFGAFYKAGLLIQKNHLVGLSFKYNFSK